MSDRNTARILANATRAFFDVGYADLTMSNLADFCGLTRRGLYHHFSSKEEVFRAALKMNNATALLRGEEASRKALSTNAPAVDVIVEWLDARFGETRRAVGASVHGHELNETAFRLATDIMIEVSYVSNRRLAELVEELVRRRQLRLRDGVSAERAGRLIGDGARGVNQARPPIPNDEIGQRYHDIVEAILFGCAIS